MNTAVDQVLIEENFSMPSIQPPQQVLFRCSDQLDKLFTAMSEAQGEMGGAKKDAENPFFKSKYADLYSVIEASRAALMKHGLCIIQITDVIEDNKMVILTTLGHKSGQWLQSRTPVINEQKTAQGMGSGITYARRYAWAAICGLAQMDDDGNAAMPVGALQEKPAGEWKKIDTKPVRWDWVKKATTRLKQIIDDDELNQESAGAVNLIWDKLTNDERIAVHENMNDKAQGSRQFYRNILKKYLAYHPSQDESNES